MTAYRIPLPQMAHAAREAPAQARVWDVLHAAEEFLTITMIARRAGVSRAVAYRLIRDLRDAGSLVTDSSGWPYAYQLKGTGLLP